MMFLEASALTGDAVEEMFFKCARSILSKIETGKTKNKMKTSSGRRIRIFICSHSRSNRPRAKWKRRAIWRLKFTADDTANTITEKGTILLFLVVVVERK